MHSKVQLWEIETQLKSLLEGNGLKLISVYDEFLLSLLREKIVSYRDISFTTVLGHELTSDWIEENLISLSLFGQSDNYIIQNGNKLSKACTDLITTDTLLLDERQVLIFFHKENDFFKNLMTHKNVKSLSVQSPKFWEMGKVIQYLGLRKGLKLDESALSLIENAVEAQLSEYFNIIENLALNFKENETLTASTIQEILPNTKIDKFALTDFFMQKKFVLFWKSINESDADVSMIRELFSFIKGHLIKVYDPSYLADKNKLSQYDKKIIQASKSWTKNSLEGAIDHFYELEFKAKIYPQTISEVVRKNLLKSSRTN